MGSGFQLAWRWLDCRKVPDACSDRHTHSHTGLTDRNQNSWRICSHPHRHAPSGRFRGGRHRAHDCQRQSSIGSRHIRFDHSRSPEQDRGNHHRAWRGARWNHVLSSEYQRLSRRLPRGIVSATRLSFCHPDSHPHTHRHCRRLDGALYDRQCQSPPRSRYELRQDRHHSRGHPR
mgnify:CR=1 FL=1